ncbi:hypothetical protein ACFXJ8_17385 [Nonomuraea sp. NPDC059194]|uniref:hypothetical protein n=1 Tax=Nonomuraea sp. NPDC059194 TaxID=3346764 RepID=UPI0036879814
MRAWPGGAERHAVLAARPVGRGRAPGLGERRAGVLATTGCLRLDTRLCASRDALLTSLASALPPMNPVGYKRTLATVNAIQEPETAAERCSQN